MPRPAPDQLNMHPFLALDPEGAARRFETVDFEQENRKVRGSVRRTVIWLLCLFGGLVLAGHLHHSYGLVAGHATMTEVAGR